jgi:hypothetical protein
MTGKKAVRIVLAAFWANLMLMQVWAQPLTKDREEFAARVLAHHSINPECGLEGKTALFQEFIQLDDDIFLLLASCEIGSFQVNWMA